VATCLFGVETEYALAPSEHRMVCLGRLLEIARDRLPHVPGNRGNDLFLANGSRLYLDCGEHPELATPECTTPSEVVRYVLAGELILDDLVGRIELPGGAKPFLFKGNVDYTGARSTWGCHESYLCRTEPTRASDDLVPHLVSRIVYTGAGGFNPFACGIEFAVSPRAWHLPNVVSKESTKSRGIFHSKDETLSTDGWHRIHLICGESLSSEIAMWLRTGATALVVAMIDAGKRPGRGIVLADPVAALRAFTADPGCRAAASLADGGSVTALQIQRRYLEAAEAWADAAFMPDWAPEVCVEWRRMLERIESDSDSLAGSVDWAMKNALFDRRIGQTPIRAGDIPAWNHVVATIDAALAAGKVRGEAAKVESVLGPRSAIADTIRGLGSHMRAHGLEWDHLRPFVDLRKQLFSIDVHFSQVQGAMFRALVDAGVLDHGAPGVGNVEAATKKGPSKGRGRLRSRVIRRSAKAARKMRASWKGIVDPEKGRRLDMSDPFVEVARWEKLSDLDRASRLLDLDLLDF
jgi:proteasome accessory factor A